MHYIVCTMTVLVTPVIVTRTRGLPLPYSITILQFSHARLSHNQRKFAPAFDSLHKSRIEVARDPLGAWQGQGTALFLQRPKPIRVVLFHLQPGAASRYVNISINDVYADMRLFSLKLLERRSFVKEAAVKHRTIVKGLCWCVQRTVHVMEECSCWGGV